MQLHSEVSPDIPLFLIDLDAETDSDDLEVMHSRAPSQRPVAFNQWMKALVRAMAELHNTWSVAYAMDKTGRYFEEESAPEAPDPVKKWHARRREFEVMTFDDQYKWVRRIEKKYPSLDQFVRSA